MSRERRPVSINPGHISNDRETAPCPGVARASLGRSWIGVSAAVVLWMVPGVVQAQSGTRSPAPTYRQSRPQGSATVGSGARTVPGATRAPVAMEGYCPVCLHDMQKWIKGSPAHAMVYDGHTYYFPDAALKAKFAANPQQYAPVMGGDCVICYAKMGERLPGNIRYGAYHGDRLYLFASAQQKQAFAANPAAYTNLDLALAGNCPVCRVEMSAAQPGKPELTVVDRGLRYTFAGEQHRKMFLSNPAKYRVAPPRPKSQASGSGARATPPPASGGSGSR
jgi:YHS domain-containing protein